MYRRMQELEVATTTDGAIDIKQGELEGTEITVTVEPGQVPLLCQWLQEAAAEIQKETAEAHHE